VQSIIRQIIDFLNRNNHFLITAHMNADGDAYASVLAVAHVLEKLGKESVIVFHDERIDEKYRFLEGFERITSYKHFNGARIEAAIILDVPGRKRIGDPANLLPPPEQCVKIDHHPFEEEIAYINLVDTKASSTSQLVYEVVQESSVELDDALATQLFTGIMYDTGRFSFSNTRRRDFEIAAHLLKFSVRPHEIANRLFFDNSFQSMKIIGYGLANMQTFLNGKLAIIHLPLEVMEQNNHSEIEELANYSVAVRGVEVGLFVREVKPNYFKISFRSRGRVNVNVIARVFGGGGHLHAAGCRFSGTYEELQQRLIQEVEKHL
jgi:phosphoesterase RecJ-like protein